MRTRIAAVIAVAGLLVLLGGTMVASAGTSIMPPETIATDGTTV